MFYLMFVFSFFFFFKQKTAYEMRISDWSSDVCSSDLCRTCSKRRARLCGFRLCCPQFFACLLKSMFRILKPCPGGKTPCHQSALPLIVLRGISDVFPSTDDVDAGRAVVRMQFLKIDLRRRDGGFRLRQCALIRLRINAEQYVANIPMLIFTDVDGDNPA